ESRCFFNVVSAGKCVPVPMMSSDVLLVLGEDIREDSVSVSEWSLSSASDVFSGPSEYSEASQWSLSVSSVSMSSLCSEWPSGSQCLSSESERCSRCLQECGALKTEQGNRQNAKEDKAGACLRKDKTAI
ncbi:hypothetical protein KUCAC02_036055, partial [Chaenocephalus aceratus]